LSPTSIGFTVLACTFGGALAGMHVLRRLVPEQHVSAATWDTAKLGIGLVATMTALLLGLVTATAKTTFDDVGNAIWQTAAELLTLDRSLSKYGPETKDIREAVKLAVARRIELTWPRNDEQVELEGPQDTPLIEGIGDRVRALSPGNEAQKDLRARALGLVDRLLESRWLVLSGHRSSIPVLFLTALVSWLTITFTIYGMFAPRNGTVVAILFVSALSVASAVFLILEMDGPFDGLLRVSPEPLMFAMSRLG
jgi:hypothetical protein